MIDLRQTSIETIRRNQTSSGAYVASPTFSQYGYSWFRDGMWIAHSMDCVGEHDSATAFHRWAASTMMRYEDHIHHLLDRIARGENIIESDYLPTRFNTDSTLGADEWPDFQLDGYGAWLWGVVQHCHNHRPDVWQDVRPAVQLTVWYLEALWQSPNYDCWEEYRDQQHLSTFAALYGGLNAVARYDQSLVCADLPEKIQQFVLNKGVSSNGHFVKFVGSELVDASLLWIALPFELTQATDPIFIQTVRKVERDIHRTDGGVYRYIEDTYFGGGEWLLLTCWLAWACIRLDQKDRAKQLIRWVEAQTTPQGAMPEQVSDYALSPDQFQSWVDRWGTPATPLLWSHAMYLIVCTELASIS